MSDELQLLRELRAEVPDMETAAVSRVYERATRSERRFIRRWVDSPVTRPRYAAAFMAVTAAATAAIALPIVFGNSGASHYSTLRSSVSRHLGQGEEPGAPTTVAVSNVDEANARLPFKAVLPSNVAPTGGIQVPIAGKPSDASGALTATFDSNDGSYLLSESSSDATVETLQQWAATSAKQCSDCAQQVVTEDGVHVLVIASPVFGLRLQWVRGDGASPVLTELDWSRDMPAQNVVPSQEAALAIAGDIIRQGG